MPVLYLDSSAAAKLLTDEIESQAMRALADQPDAVLVSCLLVETELRRMAVRADIPQTDVTAVLDRIHVAQLDQAVYREAGVIPLRQLRSLDALHVIAAIRLNADALVTYDQCMTEAVRFYGLSVLHPGHGESVG